MKKESNAAVRWGESFDWFRLTLASFNHNSIVLNQSLTTKRLAVASEGENSPGSAGSLPPYSVHRCWVWTVLAALHQLVHFQMWSGSLCSTVLHCAPVWSCSCPCCSLLIEEALVRGCWMCRFNEHGFRCHSRSSSTRSSCRNVWVLEMASENSPQCYLLE